MSLALFCKLIDLGVCTGVSCHSRNSISKDTTKTIWYSHFDAFFFFRFLQTKTFILTVCSKTEAEKLALLLENTMTVTTTNSFTDMQKKKTYSNN